LLKKFQKTRELVGDFLFFNPVHNKQCFVVNFIVGKRIKDANVEHCTGNAKVVG